MGFLGVFFCVCFFGWVFYCQPCLETGVQVVVVAALFSLGVSARRRFGAVEIDVTDGDPGAVVRAKEANVGRVL